MIKFWKISIEKYQKKIKGNGWKEILRKWSMFKFKQWWIPRQKRGWRRGKKKQGRKIKQLRMR